MFVKFKININVEFFGKFMGKYFLFVSHGIIYRCWICLYIYFFSLSVYVCVCDIKTLSMILHVCSCSKRRRVTASIPRCLFPLTSCFYFSYSFNRLMYLTSSDIYLFDVSCRYNAKKCIVNHKCWYQMRSIHASLKSYLQHQ